jgi:ATP synthase subunit 6
MSLTVFSMAVTSQFIITLFFSLSICLGIFFLGLLKQNVHYLKIFVPEVPIVLYPLMITIEIASYIIRSFSLAIRLSANILAGHILVDIIAEAIIFLSIKTVTVILQLAFILVIALYLLEFGVACLQAYVFVLLICIYMNDAINVAVH